MSTTTRIFLIRKAMTKQQNSIHRDHHHHCHHKLSSISSNMSHTNKKNNKVTTTNMKAQVMKSFKLAVTTTAIVTSSSRMLQTSLHLQLRRFATTTTASLIMRPSLSSLLGLATITRSFVVVNGERYIHTKPSSSSSSTLDILDRLQHVIQSLSSQQRQQQQQQQQDDEEASLENLIISICNEYVLQLEPMDEDFSSSTCKRRKIIQYIANQTQLQLQQPPPPQQATTQKNETQQDDIILTKLSTIGLLLDYLESILDTCPLSSSSDDDDILFRQKSLTTQPSHVLTFLVHLRYDIQQIMKQMKKQSTASTTSNLNENDLMTLQKDSLQTLSERITDIIRQQMTSTEDEDASSNSSNNLLQVHQITVKHPSQYQLDASSPSKTTTPFDVLHRLVSTDYVHPISSVKQLLRTRIFDPPLLPRNEEEGKNLILLKRRVFSLVHKNMPLLLQESGDESRDDDNDESSSLVGEESDSDYKNRHHDNDVDESLLLEPLVVVHSALTTAHDTTPDGTAGDGAAIPSRMSQLFPKKTSDVEGNDTYVGEGQHGLPTVATFYSISNTQPGLSGFGLGRVLLERAVQMLQEEFPTLDTFVTLSPLPTFRLWLENTIVEEQQRQQHAMDSPENSVDDDFTIPLLALDDFVHLMESGLISASSNKSSDDTTMTHVDALSLLLERLDQEYMLQQEEALRHDQKYPSQPDGYEDDTADIARLWNTHEDVLDPIFKKLVARYILMETKKSSSSNKIRPYDGVAGFHLGNGAQFYRINPAANLFPRTINAARPYYHNQNSSRLSWVQSWGIMVNYRYRLPLLVKNQEHFKQQHASNSNRRSHRRIPVSKHIISLVPSNLADTTIWVQDEHVTE